MAAVNEIEALLDEAARDVEKSRERQASDEARDTDSRRDDRHRDRHADRHDRRDRSRDRERHRESNGDRRRSRERRRDGSRPRSTKGADTEEDRDRTRRSSSRDRYRGGRRDRGGDYYSGGGRARSRSPRRDRGDDKYRTRDGSRDRRRGGPGAEERRGSRREKTAEPEATEDDRDKRTIFVQQISQRAETRHLRSFFEAVGPVVEAQIVKDRVTGRSKGVGYVEFKEEESVPKALELTGQKLKGVPIIAQLTEAEKNRAARPSEGGAAPGANGAPFHRLYVGNIHFSVTEKDLQEIFEPYGELEQVILQRDEMNPGRSKGYGFVQFVDPTNAKNALAEMNGFELAGRQIRVGLGNDKFTPESTANLLRTFTQQAQSYQGSAFSGAGGRGAYAGGAGGVFDRTHSKDDRGVSGASALDDTDVAGVNFKTYDRSKLMAALAGRDNPEPTKQGAQPVINKPRAPIVDKPMASKCVKIENAFDADEEQKAWGDSWVKDLEAEVKVECDKKYGKVVHIAVDPNTEGDIYVKFDSVTGGEKALQGLNGRSFNHRTIRASYVVDKIYNSLWGAAASRF
ncbi:splicing factor, CC1-like protein [Cucurbitaria berberidis CBS 394.84]|uniref:Splicing factor, CC1-like protein n=1 Tax=Cucurbitaria berberidis CBS 394.84 TaxID=1168544 RepID=A0A9P4GDZ8_9PLEO|nr:splicing factor, CC1-like protein [Cucurbitaria berberidis CBS 394.84]KAF1844203.1 splicing factor, CC1-like protein [Cucurbitaria berberidis CBS 394.84]